MIKNILDSFRSIGTMVYEIKHLSISQWDVENKEEIHVIDSRQIR